MFECLRWMNENAYIYIWYEITSNLTNVMNSKSHNHTNTHMSWTIIMTKKHQNHRILSALIFRKIFMKSLMFVFLPCFLLVLYHDDVHNAPSCNNHDDDELTYLCSSILHLVLTSIYDIQVCFTDEGEVNGCKGYNLTIHELSLSPCLFFSTRK